MPAATQPNSDKIPLSGGYIPTPAPAPQSSSQSQQAPTPPVVNPNSTFQNTVTAPITSPVPASSLNPTPSLTLPQPQATTVQQNYFGSVASDVQATKDALQSAYDKETADIKTRQDALDADKTTILQSEQTLSQPFQDNLEQTRAQQLHVNDNFEANQKLADELSSLVTEATQKLASGAGRFASNATIKTSQSNTIAGITARAGLIQAAMSAYSGQISAAYTQIDRSVAAINADRNDQLGYYNTLLQLHNNDQIQLSDEAKTNAESKIASLQKEADDAQASADTIKKAMLDPDTAQAYAQAGVTLTDTPQEINKKLGDYAYSKELSDQSNEMAKGGYNAVIPGHGAPAGAQVVTVTDSKGTAKQYYKLPTASSTTAKPTATQLTYANYAPRMAAADTTIASLTDTIANSNPATFSLQQALPSWAQSASMRQYNQAGLNFINSVLRQESGAAISADEYKKYQAQYLPVPGDDPATIALKASNRQQVIQSYVQDAGSAYSAPVPTSSAPDSNDQYADYRSQLQPGEVLVQRGNQILAIPPDELLSSDDKL